MPARSYRRRSLLLLLLLLGALAPGLPAAPRARAFSNGQAASLVLGQQLLTSNNYTTGNYFHRPSDVAIDPVSGAVFVADTINNRVLRFNSVTSLSNGATADGVLGQPNFIDNTYGTTAQKMSSPNRVAVDSTGRLWVADSTNKRVLRFDNAATKPSGAPADGVLGQPDFSSRADAATAQGMRWLSGLAVDSGGRLWVADTINNRVLRFDSAATKPNGAPADGVLGQPNFTSQTSATTSQGMDDPSGLAIDTSGHLWIADTYNNRVLRFDSAATKPNGAPADGVLGQPGFTTKQQIYRPTDLAVDGSDRLWVTDDSSNRVLRFDSAATKPNGAPADGVLGQTNFTDNTSRTTAQGMYGPAGIAVVDGVGQLWVADALNNRVLRFDNAATKPNGAPANGVLGHTSFTQQRSISASILYTPSTVVVDPATGKVFVADTGNHRVLRFAARANLTNGAPAEAVLGQPNFTTYEFATTDRGMSSPVGLAIDAGGRLWVAGGDRVLRFDNAASKANGAPADGVLGQPDFTSRTSATTAQGMRGPQKMATDSSGRLWVVDSDNARVLRFDNAAAKPNGAPADGVLGQPDFTSQTSATTSQGMSWPAGITVDSSGRLWVGDIGRVLRFDNAASKPNGAPADGVLGQPNFTSLIDDPVQAWIIAIPSEVAIDTHGRLWVLDSHFRRVLRFDNAAAKPNGAPADGVLGPSDFTSWPPPAPITAQRLGMSPWGLAVDPSGAVWVADTFNNRVLLFKDTTLLRLPEQRGSPGQVVRVPVFVDQPVTGLIAASLSVSFDPAVLRPHGDAAHPSTLTPGWLAIANPAAPGLLQLDLISTGAPASGAGTLAELEFEVLGPVGTSSPLTLSVVSLNDGDIPASTQAGTFLVEAASHRLGLRATHATTGLGLPTTAVQLSGPASTGCLTNTAGECALPGLPAGAYTLALTKTDEVSGITSYDASLILQHTSGQRVLAGPAFTAADTNGNGQVTSFDAALILQYTSGQRTLPFPAGVVWKFAPPNPLTLDQDREVAVPGVLIGDASGHLPPALLAAGAPQSAGALQLVQRGAPDAQGFRTVELRLDPDGGQLFSLEATLSFDPALVRDLRVLSGPSSGALFAADTAPDGRLRVALASAKLLPGGAAVTLRYRASGADGLRLVKAQTNQGGEPAWLPPTAQGWDLYLPLAQR